MAGMDCEICRVPGFSVQIVRVYSAVLCHPCARKISKILMESPTYKNYRYAEAKSITIMHEGYYDRKTLDHLIDAELDIFTYIEQLIENRKKQYASIDD